MHIIKIILLLIAFIFLIPFIYTYIPDPVMSIVFTGAFAGVVGFMIVDFWRYRDVD